MSTENLYPSRLSDAPIPAVDLRNSKTIDGPCCRLCRSGELQLVKPSNIEGRLESNSFSITDSHYGTTGAIYRCSNCAFLQCSDLPEVVQFYEGLEDAGYEAGRLERSSRARRILELARTLQPDGRLLDVGSGSGMLVEQAIQLGYHAEGIEPSAWLQQIARERDLPVHFGTFPHSAVSGKFDLITLIDVIEHVSNPLELLRYIAAVLAENGVAVIVTPDVNSVAARIFGWKWWHFRVAHIGYFNKRTLVFALTQAGLEPLLVRRPAWYFAADYLWVRMHQYLPSFLRFAPPRFLCKLVMPINLRDSWLIACKHKH